MPLDLVIRSGTVIDGTGAAPRTADVAIADGRIVEVGSVGAKGRREIDADGAVVAPGFVDIHTHYDGQATWDERLQPSSGHGVTTVVSGNCGVGFAPVRPGDRETLVELMEGVEDLPGTVLHEGLSWEWETIADYLDALERRRYRHRRRRPGVPRARASLRDGAAGCRSRAGLTRRDRRDGSLGGRGHPRRRARLHDLADVEPSDQPGSTDADADRRPGGAGGHRPGHRRDGPRRAAGGLRLHRRRRRGGDAARDDAGVGPAPFDLAAPGRPRFRLPLPARSARDRPGRGPRHAGPGGGARRRDPARPAGLDQPAEPDAVVSGRRRASAGRPGRGSCPGPNAASGWGPR